MINFFGKLINLRSSSDRDLPISDLTLNILVHLPMLLLFLIVLIAVFAPLKSTINRESLFEKLDPQIVEFLLHNPKLPLVFTSSKCQHSVYFEKELVARKVPYIRLDVTNEKNSYAPRNHVYVNTLGHESIIATTTLKKAQIPHWEVGRNWLGFPFSNATPVTVIKDKIIRKNDFVSVVREYNENYS
jgi:hypothetical protein